MSYICPVCGYPELDEAPYDTDGNPSYNICSCCGYEFGFDEGSSDSTFEDYRAKWINEGANWFTPNKQPKGWDLKNQLENLK